MNGMNNWSQWREKAAFVAALFLPWQMALPVAIIALVMDRVLRYLDAKEGHRM
jgi:hypothetical protein